MPKTKRDYIKRTLAQAYINLEWSGTYLANVYELYKNQHPELAELLSLSVEGIINIENLLELFAKETFGVQQPNWYAWAARGKPLQKHVKD